MRSAGRRRRSCLAVGAVLVGGLLGAANATAAVQSPGTDPFYTYSGQLGSLAPGTILKSRSVTLTFAAELSTPVTAEQLLYRTTNELGQPALAVTTVIKPVESVTTPKLVSYQTAYDSTGPDCDPSYEFRGGSAGVSGNLINGCDGLDQVEITGASTFLGQGATVVVPDYEETNEAWTDGQLEGYATLDGIRAAERYLGEAAASTRVAMMGYSGGAIPSQWAAELAPTYAPELDIVGSAAGGVEVDPYHNLLYISGDGSIDWSNILPAVLLTVFGRGFGLDVYHYTSTYGTELVHADSDIYVADLTGNLTYQQLLKPQYADIGSVPGVARDFDHLIMGSDGTPGSPMFLANGGGIANGGYQGDGVMITADVEALAHEYCSRGVAVDYEEYSGLSHEEAIVPFEGAAVAYITDRLEGLPAPSNCSSIGVGNPLTGLAIPAPKATPTIAPALLHGAARGTRLGPLRLGMTAAQAARAVPRHTRRGLRDSDFYHLSATAAIRASYPSASLLALIPRAQRARLSGRIVLLLTSDRDYTLGAIKLGQPAGRLRSRDGWRAYTVGANTWYLLRRAGATEVAAVQHGTVDQIGLLARQLTGAPSFERRVLRRFR